MVGSKKIVLITSNFPYGGASANLLRYFTFCLKEKGHSVTVVLPYGGFYGDKLDQQSKRQGNINGVFYKHIGYIFHPVNYLGKLFDNILGLILPVFYLLGKAIKKELDIIIVYNVTFVSLFIQLIIKFILSKELIIILPEYYEKPSSKFFSLATIKWYNFYFGLKYLSKYGDKFIVLSNYLKEYVESRVKSKKKILLMPNLVDPARFNLSSVSAFRSNYVTIGYVGTPTRKDGITDLIKCFGIINVKYPNTHLLIIGDITNGKSVINQLKEQVSESKINANNVTFTGLTSHLEIPQLLLSCQILSLTRPNGIFAEAGFPTKLGEYFACKKPVVITKVGDMKNYFIDKEQVVFAEPENIPSIVEAFEFLIKNPNKADKIGLNGYKWMDSNLNYRNQIGKIAEFIVSGNKI